SGGVPHNTVDLSYSKDGMHKQEMEAVAQDWRETLGVKVVPHPVSTSDFYQQLANQTVKGVYFTAFVPDYPAASGYLDNLFGAGWGNYNDWRDDSFDAAVKAGNASSLDDSIALYAKAATIVSEQLPVIPLWDVQNTYLVGKDVTDVTYDPMLQLQLQNAYAR
ncbi:MAG: hypothetical protein ACRDQA_28325, partial [Nocardioidaceae bacterium]